MRYGASDNVRYTTLQRTKEWLYACSMRGGNKETACSKRITAVTAEKPPGSFETRKTHSSLPGPRLRSTFNLASFFFRGLIFFFCPRECALSFIPQRFIIFHYAHGDGHGLGSNSLAPPDETGRPVVLYMLGQDQTAAVTYSVSGSYGRRCAATLALPITVTLIGVPPSLTCSLFRLFAPPERKRPSFFAASSTKEALACVAACRLH